MKKAIAFTDGASTGNPGPGGFGAIIVSGSEVFELGGAEAKTTNNRMELKAVIEVLKKTKSGEICIATDSAYVFNGAQFWIQNWQKNGWKTQNKKDVLNKDLWVELSKYLDKIEIEWKHVPGHSNIPGNERADEIATSFAGGTKIKLFSGSVRDYPISDLWGKGIEIKRKVRNTGKAYSYVSCIDGKIQKHNTWAECEERVRGKRARFKKALSPENEAEIIKEFRK